MKIALISTNERLIEHGFRTISSILRNNGFETIMVFMPTGNRYSLSFYSKDNLEELFKLVKDYDMVCLSCMSGTFERTIQVIDFLKTKMNAFFVIGGIHATLMPENCIKQVDAVGIGECEDAIVELCKRIEGKRSFYKTKNFWFNKKGKIIKNDIRPLVNNLDLLPFPDYELEHQFILDKNKFVCATNFFKENFWKLYNGRILILSARGCPYSCTYCSNNYLNKIYKGKSCSVRKKSVDGTIAELKYLVNKFPETVEVLIDDDVFLVRDIKEIKDFAKKYKKEIGLPFKCNCTPVAVSEKKIATLVDAGLSNLIVGVQSGSERVNFEVYKRFFSKKCLVNAMNILAKFPKLHAHFDVIVSNPFETPEELKETINFFYGLNFSFSLSVFNLIYFPKTELRQRVIEKFGKDFENRINIEYFDDFSHIKYDLGDKYLNTILRCMSGKANKKKMGWLPRFVIKPLIRLYDSPIKWIGWIYLYSTILFKTFIKQSYFYFMPLFPQRVKSLIINLVVSNKKTRKIKKDVVEK